MSTKQECRFGRCTITLGRCKDQLRGAPWPKLRGNARIGMEDLDLWTLCST